MLNVYQAFKIILGLIAAAFILAASLQIAAVYKSGQEGFRGSLALSQLLRTGGDVQRTGNPASLTGLPAFTVDADGLLSGADRIPLPFSLLIVPSDTLFLDAQRLDLGWWTFRSASATPESTFVFSFESADPRLLASARSLLSALPNSQNFEPTASYALCTGASLATALCDQPCERESFRPLLAAPPTAVCTAPLPEHFIRITFADSCSAASTGLCIEPTQANGLTPAYRNGERFLAKDPIDLAALALESPAATALATALASSEAGVGSGAAAIRPAGSLFDLKNQQFTIELSVAARAKAAQSRLLADQLESAVTSGRLAEGSDAAACVALHRAFAQSLDPLPAFLDAEQWHRSEVGAAAVVSQLSTIRTAYTQLKNGGCVL